jgi:hypothetical protein
MFADELRTRGFLAGGTPLNERGFTPADIGPTGDPRVLHRELHYTKLDPGVAGKFQSWSG